MAIELSLFMLILGIGGALFVLAHSLNQSYLYIFGALTIFFSGLSLFVFDGLLLSYYYTVDGVLASNVIGMSNLFLLSFGLVLIGIGFISFFKFAFQPKVVENQTFHY